MITTDKALVSVIIPVYSVEKYLDECVCSVLAQTYESLEVILVDDGSPDECGAMCDRYAASDSRVKTVHKKNGGLSSARNAGLKIAQGDYIVCIDSDDAVSGDYIEYMLGLIKRYKTDAAICQVGGFKDGKSYHFTYNDSDGRKIKLEETLKMSFNLVFETNVLGKMFSREVYEGVRYPEGKKYEDIYTIYRLMKKVSHFAYGADIKCAYRMRETAQSRQLFDPSEMDAVEQAGLLYDDVCRSFPGLAAEAACRVLSSNFHIFFTIPYGKYHGEKKEIWSNIKKLRAKVISGKNLRRKARYAAFLSYSGKMVTHLAGAGLLRLYNGGRE